MQPALVVAHPQARNGKAEGYGGGRKTQEKSRGVNRHPVVLQQWIQSVSLDQAEVVGVGKNGRVHRLTQKQQRVAADSRRLVAKSYVNA